MGEFAGQKAHGRELSQNGGEQRARTQPKDNTESARGSACLTERQGVDLRASTEGTEVEVAGRARSFSRRWRRSVGAKRGPRTRQLPSTRLQRLRGHLASLGASKFFFSRGPRTQACGARGDQPQ